MLLIIEPLKSNTLSEFCKVYMYKICFWDTITYRTKENHVGQKFITKIGDIGPNVYQHLCSEYMIKYKLLNGTQYLSIKDNSIFSNANLDRDTHYPGACLLAEIECSVQRSPNDIPSIFRKTIQINILDRNDNHPYVQANHNQIDIVLNRPQFDKVCITPFDCLLFQRYDIIFYIEDLAAQKVACLTTT